MWSTRAAVRPATRAASTDARRARPPELIEGGIEARYVFVTMDQQRPHRGADVAAPADADRFHRGHDVGHPAGVDADACVTKERRKSQHVVEERVHYAREADDRIGRRVRQGLASARPTSASACWPLHGDRYLPGASAARRASAPRWRRRVDSRLSATSAAAQSSVSDTPAALYRSSAAQLLHERGHLRGEPLRRSGNLRVDDPPLLLESRIVDPGVEAPALERVVDFARAVGGDDDDRRDSPRGWCRARGSSPESRTAARADTLRTPRRRDRSRR